MPEIKVNGVNIAYEVAGDGAPVVFTGGGRSPREPFVYAFCGRFSATYKVFIWDRRNSGESDVLVEDSESEFHLWTDDLHAILNELGMTPAHIGGGSGGYVTSLLMAHRYPEDVKSLILHCPMTDDVDLFRSFGEGWFTVLAAAAESGGMEEVIHISSNPPVPELLWASRWVTDYAAKSPENRDRVLSQDAKQFARIMGQWADWLTPRLYLANLSDEEVQQIAVPAQVSYGLNDDLHPEHTARHLFSLLSNAEFLDHKEHYSEEEIVRAKESRTSNFALYAPFFEDFLSRVESGTFVAEG